MAQWPPHDRMPDFQEQLEPLRRFLRRWGYLQVGGAIAALVLLLWLASGFYVVGPGERGVVLLFGRVVGQTEPGLRYRLPAPFQSHLIVDIAAVRRAEVGFRTDRGQARSVPTEALMLTGDENIVDVQLFVQYLVIDPVKFLFGARQPERALHASAEVALRAAVGENTIDHTMTEGRVEVQDRVRSQLQQLLDLYETGLQVTDARLLVVDPPREVQEAFHDVVRAWEDRERLIQESQGYRESVVPRARGEAVQMIREAEAYREQRLIRATGDADRFVKVLDEYRKAEAVTRDRLYLEMIDRVLPKTDKIVLDSRADQSTVLPFLPLRQMTPSPRETGPRTASPGGPEPPVQPAGARR